MKSSEIPRMQFRETDTDSELHKQRMLIATESQRLLGYGRLALALATPGALLYVLRELKIEPLDHQKTKNYMQSKVKTGMFSGMKRGILGLIGLVLFATMAVVLGNTKTVNGTVSVFSAFIVAIVGAVFSAVWSLVYADRWKTGTRVRTSWEICRLQDYSGNVPEYVLAKAVQIKAALPKTEFLVSRLTETSEYVKPLPDPFLIAQLGSSEEYFIDVWDETTYKI